MAALPFSYVRESRRRKGRRESMSSSDVSQETAAVEKESPAMRKHRLSNHTRAIGFVILNSLGFSLMTLFVRMSGDIPTLQKIFFRNSVALVISFILLAKSPEHFHIRKDTFGYVLARCITGFLGMVLNFWAIDHLVLADANILNKMSPFFAMIMSIFILSEIPSRFEWGCIIIAFVGVLFIVKPTAGLASLPALIGLLSGLGAGTAYTFLRKATGKGERGVVVVFCFSLFCTVFSLPVLLFHYTPMSLIQWGYLTIAGFAAALGQFAITAAYTLAPAKEISVFDYSQVIFASLWGALFFGELPDRWSILGYVIVIVTAVVKWKYQLNADKNVEKKAQTLPDAKKQD